MTLRATSRLITAVVVVTGGVLVAVLAGRAEAAVLVLPWLALLVLGLSGSGRDRATARLATPTDRVLVGQPVAVETVVGGLDGGWVEAIWRPPAPFAAGPDHHGDLAGGADGRAGVGDPAAPGEPVHDPEVEASAEVDRGGGPGSEPVTAVGEVVDGRGRASLECVLPARAWGTHDVGRVELRVHHRYGLSVASGLARQPLPVRVHPRPIDLRHLLAPWHVRRLTGAHRSRAAARGVEYADIRAYGPGDSPRDINWRASARSNGLLVSQRHPDRSTHAILFVDSFGDAGVELPAVLGETIEAAMALAETHLSVSDRVGLVDLGGIVRWVTPGSGRHHLERLVDALLTTRVFRSEVDRSITTLPTRAVPPRSFVVALSPLVDERFVRSLFALRAGGHDVAVVELVPAVDPAASRPTDPAAALGRRLWEAERERTRDLLAEAGIAVARRHLRGLGPTADPDPTETDPTDDHPTDWPAEPWDRTLADLGLARRGLVPLIRP